MQTCKLSQPHTGPSWRIAIFLVHLHSQQPQPVYMGGQISPEKGTKRRKEKRQGLWYWQKELPMVLAIMDRGLWIIDGGLQRNFSLSYSVDARFSPNADGDRYFAPVVKMDTLTHVSRDLHATLRHTHTHSLIQHRNHKPIIARAASPTTKSNARSCDHSPTHSLTHSLWLQSTAPTHKKDRCPPQTKRKRRQRLGPP